MSPLLLYSPPLFLLTQSVVIPFRHCRIVQIQEIADKFGRSGSTECTPFRRLEEDSLESYTRVLQRYVRYIIRLAYERYEDLPRAPPAVAAAAATLLSRPT